MQVMRACETLRAERIMPDLAVLNTAIMALAEKKDLAFAWKLFAELVEQAGVVRPDATTFDALLRCCSTPQDVKRAFWMYDVMQTKYSIAPTVAIHQSLLLACAEGGEIDVAMEMLERLLADKTLPAVHTYTQLILHCVRHKRAREAHAVLQELELTGVRPDEKLYWSVLAACALSREAPGCVELLDVITGKLGLPVDRGTLAGLLHCAAATGSQELGRRLEAEWLARGYGQTDELRAGLLHCHVNARDFKSCFRLLMSGPELVVEAQQPLVDLAASSPQRSDEAFFALVGLVRDEGLQATAACFGAIIRACGQLSDVARLEATFAELERYGVRADGAVHDALVEGLACAGEHDAAVQRMRGMAELGFAASVRTQSAVLTALVRAGQLGEAQRLFDDMRLAERVPSRAAMELMVKKAARVGDAALARALVARFESECGLQLGHGARQYLARHDVVLPEPPNNLPRAAARRARA